MIESLTFHTPTWHIKKKGSMGKCFCGAKSKGGRNRVRRLYPFKGLDICAQCQKGYVEQNLKGK